jgi:hypothetical protein
VIVMTERDKATLILTVEQSFMAVKHLARAVGMATASLPEDGDAAAIQELARVIQLEAEGGLNAFNLLNGPAEGALS